eukprot:RCo050368
MMQTMDWVSFELMALIAGNLGTAELAAHSILVTLVPVGSYCYFGLGAAAASLVGQYLGQGCPDRAVRVIWYSLAVGVLIVLLLVVLSLTQSGALIDFFTADVEVHRGLRQIVLFAWVFTPLDMVVTTCQGVVRGAGKQLYGTFAVLFGSYVV